MDKEKSLFEKILLEADGDPPDINMGSDNNSPPNIPSQNQDTPQVQDTPQPDVEFDDNSPPDLGDGDFNMDNDNLDNNNQEMNNTDEMDNIENNGENNLNIGEKISAIMNVKLYQDFLSVLNLLGDQLSVIKDNSDTIYSISPESSDIVARMKKLNENVRMYLTNSFSNENYSKNQLFFNKVINLVKLLNDLFNKSIQKGVKSTK